MFRIYAIKFKDEMIYVGQTAQSVDQRFFKHLNNARHDYDSARVPKLYAHMRENNFEGYKFELLEVVIDKEDVSSREKYWIDFYTTKDKCNTTAGGITSSGPDHYLYGVKDGMKKAREASIAARKGKPLSLEHRIAQSKGHLIRHDVRPIRCIQTGQVWESIVACADHFTVTGSAIKNRINRDANKKLGHNVHSALKDLLFEKIDK